MSSETSLESYMQTLPSVETKQGQVLTAIIKGGGLTCRQVEVITRLTHQSASARIKELLDENLIYIAGTTWDYGTKRNVRVYKPK